jgi:hypothetical protein
LTGQVLDAGKIKAEYNICKRIKKLLYRGTGIHQFRFFCLVLKQKKIPMIVSSGVCPEQESLPAGREPANFIK